NPKGNQVAQKRVRSKGGHAHVVFDLPSDARGGRYVLRADPVKGDGKVERPVMVSAFEEPRIKKELEFVREAYGEGDRVTATLSLKRGTDEPLADHPVEGTVRVDGETLDPISTTTDGEGNARVRFDLPEEIERPDGILTVEVSDGGVTESISRRIPIVLNSVELEFYPEGGDLVAGLPSRVYFAAERPDGEPADVAGHVENGDGEKVATFRSFKKGMGRFSFTPEKGESYRAVLQKPAGIEETFDLPDATSSGCVLEHFDDFQGQRAATRVAVRCTDSRPVVVSAFMRNNPLDVAAVQVPEDEPAVVYLEPDNPALKNWQGVTRVTLFDKDLKPMAERLVYRRRGHQLNIEVEPDKQSYQPREQVELTVTTTGPDGNVQPARLAMSVVDDKVVSFADSDTPHLLSKLLLAPELPGELDKPNEFFDPDEEHMGYALDLLMGTRGYRRFEWKKVLGRDGAYAGRGAASAGDEEAGPRPDRPPEHPRGKPEPRPEKKRDDRADRARRKAGEMANQQRAKAEADRAPAGKAAAGAREPAAGAPAFDLEAENRAIIGELQERKAKRSPRWVKVREFPVPDYDADYSGPRTDFRDTIYWNPDIKTGNDGEATVTFPPSDAITSFRVFTEGVGGGYAGRDETVFESTLPFNLQAKLPLEVSEGDRLKVPVTLTNERDEAIQVQLTADFGEYISPVEGSSLERSITVGAGERASEYIALKVAPGEGTSSVSLKAKAGGLTDSVEREIRVSPRGFPRKIAKSGELEGEATHTVDLSKAREGTITGSVEVYPGPVSSMTDGMEGLIREPHGCFEQASSTNYPNVMLLRYIRESGTAAPDVVSKAKEKMDDGYKKLVGYETSKDGYEWFGKAPGHEALTAYGLLQFTQMEQVWGGVDQSMIDRTARWLMSRRDGKGGYKQNPKALDSFGRASDTVTDAYITYSLTKAGYTDRLETEIDHQIEQIPQTEDAYVLALATNTALNAGRDGPAATGVQKLLEMQGENGAWTNADHSITKSRGKNLHVETTSLAALALIQKGGQLGAVRKAV
ncbi:MAG: alpha-2-macroglobulin family protein, partial [Bradymonadaceae bacterium]